MLKRLSPRERLEQLAATWEPVIRQAWDEAIEAIKSAIVLKRIIERLERHDIAGAVRALGIDDVAFRPLEEAIRQTFNAGGIDAVSGMPTLRDPDGYQVRVQWDIRNLGAEAWLREHSTTLVTNIVADQQVALRTAFEEGLARGDNPTRTAITVAGRVNRATGRRQGGIVGLTGAQGRFVANARQELLAGDPEGIRNYLDRSRRDKRFDRTVAKALRERKPLPRETVDKIVGRYADGLLKLRADTIALNETFNSLAASKDLAFRQQIEAGKLRADAVTKTWHHTPQEHPRVQHVEMQGQKVQFDQPFVAPDGTLIPYPHAPGVPAKHTLGCKCLAEYRIDFVAQMVR
ncbi:MAG: head morphogenesis protein [Mesorhizobium sp.]